MEELRQADWTTLVVAASVVIGVLLTPYELLLVVQRRWEQQRREGPVRGEGLPAAQDDEAID